MNGNCVSMLSNACDVKVRFLPINRVFVLAFVIVSVRIVTAKKKKKEKIKMTTVVKKAGVSGRFHS